MTKTSNLLTFRPESNGFEWKTSIDINFGRYVIELMLDDTFYVWHLSPFNGMRDFLGSRPAKGRAIELAQKHRTRAALAA